MGFDNKMSFGETVVCKDEYAGNIHVRTREDLAVYAVFDDIEQVSQKFGIREYGQALAFARGYETAKHDDTD